MYFLIKMQKQLKCNSLTSPGSWKTNANRCRVDEAQPELGMKTTPLLKWMDSCPPSQSSSCLLAHPDAADSMTGSFLQGHRSIEPVLHPAEPCTQSKAAALQSKPPCSNQTGALLIISVLPGHGVVSLRHLRDRS